MKILVNYQNKEYEEEIKYVFALIFGVLGVKYEMSFNNKDQYQNYNNCLLINYGKKQINIKDKKTINIYESNYFSEYYLKFNSIPRTPLKKIENISNIDGGLPIFFGNGDNKIFFSETNIFCPIDIIATIFFVITRYEEVVIQKKDKYKRFPAQESILFKENILDRPIVNDYIELIWDWINKYELGIKRNNIWGGKEFAFCLSHDVDRIRKYYWNRPPYRSVGSLLIKKGDYRSALKQIFGYLKSTAGFDAFNNFNYLQELETKYSLRSTFYLMGGASNIIHDDKYAERSGELKKIIKKIKSHPNEIGLHSSFESYDNEEILKKEKENLALYLGMPVWGCRQHFMRFKVPDTWRIQEKAGFLYDSSMTYPEHEGFRSGFCLPFKPYDVIQRRQMNIWELPLIVMDVTLNDPGYRNLNPSEAFERILHNIETVKKYKGVFTLLWHNTSFDSSLNWSGWKKVYENILAHLGKEKILVTTAKEVIDLWRARK